MIPLAGANSDDNDLLTNPLILPPNGRHYILTVLASRDFFLLCIW